MERIMRKAGTPDSRCRMIVELDGHIDPEFFSKNINRSPLLQWMVNVRKTKKLPFILPRWRSNGSENTVSVVCHDMERVCTRKNGNFLSFPLLDDQGETLLPLFFILANSGDDRSTCILNWDHTFMDAQGAEILMQHVARCLEPQENIESLQLLNGQNIDCRVPESSSFANRLSYARGSTNFILEASAAPIAVLKPASNSKECADQFFTIRFNEEETRQIISQCESMGLSYYHSLFYLAASIRAVHAVRKRDMDEDVPYFVPVPLSLRKKGGFSPVFSNNVTFLFYRILPEEVEDFKTTTISLKKQMRNQVMQEIPHSYAEMMKILRRVPLPFYAWLLSGPTKGKLASFFFSYTGQCCSEMDSFMGQPVREVTHLAPATSIPGLSIVFMRHRNCLKAIFSFRDSLFGEKDRQVFEEQLRIDLLLEKS
jgi:hypothetical protein